MQLKASPGLKCKAKYFTWIARTRIKANTSHRKDLNDRNDVKAFSQMSVKISLMCLYTQNHEL